MKFFLTLTLLFLSGWLQAQISWQDCLGGSLSDEFDYVTQTPDGNFIAVGSSESNDGDVAVNYGLNDAFVVKFDAEGQIIWKKIYGTDRAEYPSHILPTSDQGYLITGSEDLKDFLVLKIDADGNLLWQQIINHWPNSRELALSAVELPNGNFILAGGVNTESETGILDLCLVTLSPSGDWVGIRTYGGTANDVAYSIAQTTDNGFIVLGYSNSNDGQINQAYGDYDMWVLKLNADLDIEWQKNYGGSGAEEAEEIRTTPDGYIFAGRSNSNDGDLAAQEAFTGFRGWIVKIDLTGQIQWQQTLAETDSTCLLTGLVAGSDDTYYVCGYQYGLNGTYGLLAQLNAQGVLNYRYPLSFVGFGSLHQLLVTPQNQIYMVGTKNCSTQPQDFDFNALILKVDGNLLHTQDLTAGHWLRAYPNPFSAQLHIESPNDSPISLWDVFGHELLSELPQNHQVDLELSALGSGVYFLKNATGQVIKLLKI